MVKTFFGNVQKLYNLFSSSPSRWKILQEIAQISLHRLSVTRWSARIEAVKPLAKRPREILEALNSLKEHDLPAHLCNDVNTLGKWLSSFEYALLVSFSFKVLQAINDVSLLLQNSEITIDEELQLIKSLQDDLKRIREAWHVILEESKLVAGALGLNEQFQEKRQRIRKAFCDENRDNECEIQDNGAQFRINVFTVTLDRVISEVTRRFETSEQLNNMFCFLWRPSSSTGQEDLENSDPSPPEDVENTYKNYCRDLSKFYPNDLNEDQMLEEVRLLYKLKQNDNLIIRPIFDYCVCTWAGCNKTDSNTLERLQRRAARIVLKTASSDVALEGLKWGNLYNRRNEHILKLVDKCLKGCTPQHFKQYFRYNRDIMTRTT